MIIKKLNNITMMICKFPVLFQLLLAITFSFSPLRGMEEEQVQPQQTLVQENSLFESIICVPFGEWQANYPHKACANKVKERLHSKSQTGTFSIDVFITDKNNPQGALTNPNTIQVCSFIPKAVFFNDIPYIQRGGFPGWNQQEFIKNIKEQSHYQYALPAALDLNNEFDNFRSIFFPEDAPSKKFSFLRGSLFEQKISERGLILNALLEELESFVQEKNLQKNITKALSDYLLDKKPYKDSIGQFKQEENPLKDFLKQIQEDLGLEKYTHEKLHTFLGRIKDDLEMDQNAFQEEQKIINHWKRDFFSLFKLAFANEGIGPHSSHQELKKWFNTKSLKKEIKERLSSRDFLEQAFRFLGYDKENKETLNNYYSHLETSIPFYVFKHKGFRKDIEKIRKQDFPLLVNFTLYTHKNACEGCLGDSFLLWSLIRDAFFKDIPMTYTSVFNKEDDLILKTNKVITWEMGNKLYPPFSFCNPGDYRVLNQPTLTTLDFSTLYLSAFIQGREWLPHVYKSKDVQEVMAAFLNTRLRQNDYFIKNNPLWEQLSEKEKEEQLKKVIDFYPLSLNTTSSNQ